MQPKLQQQAQKKSILLYNSEASKLFLPYLKLSDLLASASVSKEWQYSLRKYIKQSLLPEPYGEKATDVFETAKLVFNRRIALKDPNNNVKQLQFPQICCNIEMGNYFTKFETLEGNIYVAKNAKLTTLTKKDWKDSNLVYKLESRFKDVRCIGSYLYLVGESEILRYNTTAENMFEQQVKVEVSGTIQKIITSISATLAVVMTENKTIQYTFFTHKQPAPKKIQIGVSIQCPSTDITLDFGTHGFVLSSEGVLYEADFETQKAKLTEHKFFKGKNIARLRHGYKHYYTYQRKKTAIKKWNTAEVIQWAEQEGFDSYVKIFEAEKVTGQKLLTMNKSYMEDVLGITNTLTQQKINYLIQENNKNSDKFEDYIVHCWGKNDKGQLCVNPSANITNPIKLKIPQQFQIMECFAEHTVLLNKKTKQISINSVDEQGKLKWQPISSNKVWAIHGSKHSLIICESVGRKNVPQSLSQQPIQMKKQKLRTAKNIIDKIQWDTNMEKSAFSVGYLSRHEGNLECGFEEFIKSDVKENNILYFKKNGKLVWDKKTRLDIV